MSGIGMWASRRGRGSMLGLLTAVVLAIAVLLIPAGAKASTAPLPGATIATDDSHTCSINMSGALYCWGNNFYGGAGDPSTVGSYGASNPKATQVGTANSWRSVTVGSDDSCGVMVDGTAWCWGLNQWGTLGTTNNVGSTSPNPTPIQVGSESDWVALSAADQGYHTCGIKTNGTIWCWGVNRSGELGSTLDNNVSVAHPTPMQVGTDTDWIQVSVAARHSCGLKSNGTIWCWGGNESDQFLTSIESSDIPHPTPMQVGAGSNWRYISTSLGHTCGIQQDNTAWCWGSNYYGELGSTMNMGSGVPLPSMILVDSVSTWSTISAGVDNTCGVKTDGTTWCWGSNNQGQSGQGLYTIIYPFYPSPSATPEQVTIPGASSVAAGYQYTCALATAGDVWCWGFNSGGQLGNGSGDPAANGHPVPGLVVGYDHGVAAPTYALTLAPNDGSAISSNTYKVSATLVDAATRAPVVGATVQFSITSGPNAGNLGACQVAAVSLTSCVTDANGQAGWTYQSGSQAGRDTIQATFVPDPAALVTPSVQPATATVTWSVDDQYRAMGDSFSSGEGVSPFFPDSNTSLDACDRSTRSYSELLAAQIPGLHRPNVVACSGAVTSDLFNTNHTPNLLNALAGGTQIEPAQIGAEDDSTKLVTLTVGGNDLGFPDIMAACVQGGPCNTSDAANNVPTELSALSGAGDPSPVFAYTKPLNQISIYSWVVAIRKIHLHYPNARIAVAGYPILIDAKGSGWYPLSTGLTGPRSTVCVIGYFAPSSGQPTGPISTGVPVYMTPEAATWLAAKVKSVNASLKTAVSNSGVSAATFVPVNGEGGTVDQFAGHRLCDLNPWINGVTAGGISAQGPLQFTWPGSFHPNADGQAAYARAFASVLPKSF